MTEPNYYSKFDDIVHTDILSISKYIHICRRKIAIKKQIIESTIAQINAIEDLKQHKIAEIGKTIRALKSEIESNYYQVLIIIFIDKKKS